MSDHPRTGRGARGILIAQATVLGLLVLLTALAARARPDDAAGAARAVAGDPPPAELARPAGEVASRASVARAPAPRPTVAPEVRTAGADGAPAADREQEHYARYRALLAQDPAALERAAPSILLGDAPDTARVGLLRALEDGRSPAATGMLDLALSSGAPTARSTPVQDFALRRLTERAPRDPEARAALREAVWGRRAATDPSLRRRAASRLAATATEDELAAGFPELALEPDPVVVQAFESALLERANEGVAALDPCAPSSSDP